MKANKLWKANKQRRLERKKNCWTQFREAILGFTGWFSLYSQIHAYLGNLQWLFIVARGTATYDRLLYKTVLGGNFWIYGLGYGSLFSFTVPRIRQVNCLLSLRFSKPKHPKEVTAYVSEVSPVWRAVLRIPIVLYERLHCFCVAAVFFLSLVRTNSKGKACILTGKPIHTIAMPERL